MPTKARAVYIQGGDIINRMTDGVISDPAICIDRESGTVHAWGNKTFVYASYTRFTDKFFQMGLLAEANDLTYIELNAHQLGTDRCAYILERCVSYTASGFQQEFCSKLQHCGPQQMLDWVDTEMRRVPIDLSPEG